MFQIALNNLAMGSLEYLEALLTSHIYITNTYSISKIFSTNLPNRRNDLQEKKKTKNNTY